MVSSNWVPEMLFTSVSVLVPPLVRTGPFSVV